MHSAVSLSGYIFQDILYPYYDTENVAMLHMLLLSLEFTNVGLSDTYYKSSPLSSTQLLFILTLPLKIAYARE